MNQRYDIIFIQQYLEGKLSADDMHRLERAALEDPMLQDAIEGFSDTKAINHKQISLLQQRLESRIIAHQEEKNRFYFTGQRLAVASVSAVLMIVVAVLFWMMNTQTNSNKVDSNQSEVFIEVQNKPEINLVSGFAVPVKGWDDYQDYLSINGITIKEGIEIRLSFSVKNSRPSDIKIISQNSLDQAKRIISLIEDGPLWKGNQGEVIIRF